VPPFSVLHVCMGNICRSPMAERLLMMAARELVGDKTDELLLVHGAGTGGWHVGGPMDPGAARQVRARGGDPGGFAARQLCTDLVEASDLILTATADQQQYVVSLRPDAAARTFVLGEFGRLLRGLDTAALPPFAPHPDAVHARGTALVSAVADRRGGQPPRPGDDLDDPWGRGDTYFARVADTIDRTVRPLAVALLTAGATRP
jgi:low molecular weight protein-tyrosine phosphatase